MPHKLALLPLLIVQGFAYAADNTASNDAPASRKVARSGGNRKNAPSRFRLPAMAICVIVSIWVY